MSPTVTITGKKLKLSNLDKVLYPACGFTKAQIIDYYRNVSDYLLPHLHDRPITLKRYPDGVDRDFFYEKQCPSHKPDWVQTVLNEPIDKHFCVINDLASLVWVANLASVEIHTYLSTAEDLNKPTLLVFDLDPGPGCSLLDCLEIALIMRRMLEGLGLRCFPKTSGGKGLHFYVPLNTDITFEQTKYFAKTAARIMEKHYPDRVVSKMAKQLRHGKVFIDWSQNSLHKTTVCVYSLRAQPEPTVSMPLRWEQIEQSVESKDTASLVIGPAEAIELLNQQGDLFKEVLSLQQKLPEMPSTGTKPPTTPLPKVPDHLAAYRIKRDFTQTTEPRGGSDPVGQNLFVIQKHAATRLHYDLRLQVDNVLKSWAVPKGPSSDPADKRLAVMTEDHPMEYKDFEGQIPPDQYGGGQVIVWDQGTYQHVTVNSKKQPISCREAIENGKIEVLFEGEKIRGKYALVQLKGSNTDPKNWLLIKLKDNYVNSLPADLEQAGESVISGYTIKDLKKMNRS